MVEVKNKKIANKSGTGDLKNKTESVNVEIIDETPANPSITKSYFEAGKLVDSVLNFAVSKVKEGIKVYELCKIVDEDMVNVCKSIQGSGVAFPCAISPNDIICHFSPTITDPETILKQGDLIKIELGVHVDNCPAFVCHSMVVGSEVQAPTEIQQNLLKAAWTAAQATVKDLRPGQSLVELTDKFANIPSEFGVNYTQGLMTHVIARNNLAGDKGLVYRPTPEQRKIANAQVVLVEENEVYLVDVVMSSGKYAVARPTTHRTSIYKKSGNIQALRFKSSRQFISEIGQKHGLMAFSLRQFGTGESRARMGLKECMGAELVHSYDVIADVDETAQIARFAFTVIIGKDSNEILTHPFFKN